MKIVMITGSAHKNGTTAVLAEQFMKGAAEAIVFVSPIYYYDINAQIKAVMDRFYANDAAMHGSKKTALLVALADDQRKSADGAVASFENMAEYLEWQVAGTVIAAGCGDADALKSTNYPQEAYEMGKNL